MHHLLNELGKTEIKSEALSSVLSLFRNEFNNINNTGTGSESMCICQQL